MQQGTPGKDDVIVTGSEGEPAGQNGQHGHGQSAGQEEAAAQASLGAIPPSFGASSPPPPEAPPSEPTAPEPSAPEPTAPESTGHLESGPAPSTSVPPILPELQDTSAVGWYPSQPAGPPSAGPFAAPATPARRGISGIGGLTRAARPKSGRPSWRNRRGTLANVLLFGLGPLVLVGVVVAAFLLVSPGKGTAASSVGFQAGPGATAQPGTTSAPAARPSSAAPAKHRARPTPSAAVAKVPTISRVKPKATAKAKAKAKTTPKPAHRSAGVTPHNLGLPNFAGYCQHIGHRTAKLTADNAYGWHCTLDPGLVLQIANVCAWTYHLSASQVVGVSTNYSDPNAWQCWRITRDLGVLNVTAYCVAAHLGSSELVADNAYGWDCTSPLAPVNTTVACDTVYHVTDAVSRFAVFADPYSWQCWV